MMKNKKLMSILNVVKLTTVKSRVILIITTIMTNNPLFCIDFLYRSLTKHLLQI